MGYESIYSDISSKETEAKKQLAELERPTQFRTQQFVDPSVWAKEVQLRRRIDVQNRLKREAASKTRLFLGKLGEQRAKVKEYERKGYTVKKTDEGLQFTRTIRKTKRGRPQQVVVTWRDKHGKQYTTHATKGYKSFESTLKRNRPEAQIIKVENVGRTKVYAEAKPIYETVEIKQPGKQLGDITVRHIGMDKDIDLGFGKQPEQEKPITDVEVLLGRQLGLGEVETFKEIQKVRFEKYKFEVAQYEKREIKVEKTKGELKRLMEGTPIERIAGLGIWATTGLLSWGDPFGIPSAYYALRGEPEKAIETKARAIVGLPIGKPWSAERFKFLERAYTGPLAMVGITYGVSAGLGASIGAFEATTIGKYPLLISRGTKMVASVAKPLWTLTPAKGIELGIGGYFGFKAIEQAIPVVATAKETGDYAPLAGYLSSLAIYGYTGIKGYKLGKVYGYGRAEEYLYLRETYTPGTKEYIRFKSALKVARELESIKPGHIKTLDLARDIQELTPEGVKALSSVLLAKKRVITIGGSAASYPQVRGARLPRDIDFLISGWKRNLRFVETRLKKVHGVDIHGKEFGYPGQYHRFGFLEQPRVKISVALEGKIFGKFKALRASEQLFRKGVASIISERRYRWGEYPGFPKPPDVPGVVKGKKDIFDFVTHARSLITDAYKNIFTGGRAIRAEQTLEIFLHPEKAPSFVKGALPVKPKSFFWKSAFGEIDMLGEVGFSYPKIYPIGTSLGYVPSTIQTELPSYIPSMKISYPKSIMPVETLSYIPIDKKTYVPSKTPKYIPTITPGYTPTYIPTQPTPYIPTTPPEYTPSYPPSYTPGYTPTITFSYIQSYQPPYTPGYTPPPQPPRKKKIRLPDTTYKLFGHTFGQGYNVKVRERHYVKGKKVKEGKLIKINKRPLDIDDAKSLMGMLLDKSAAASGKIVPVNAMAQKSLIDLKPFEDIVHKFYLKDDVFIEKPRYRIDSKGEVKGISALGWYAERTKKAAKRKTTVRKPRVRKQKAVDMFDMNMNGMLIDMDKIFKGVFNGFQ